MTAFEQGYKAFLDGLSKEMNPYDFDDCPFSRKRWDAGWLSAKAKRSDQLK